MNSFSDGRLDISSGPTKVSNHPTPTSLFKATETSKQKELTSKFIGKKKEKKEKKLSKVTKQKRNVLNSCAILLLFFQRRKLYFKWRKEKIETFLPSFVNIKRKDRRPKHNWPSTSFNSITCRSAVNLKDIRN